MSELFENDDELLDEDAFVAVTAETIGTEKSKLNMDARRRLEYLLEEKRLRFELDEEYPDFWRLITH